MHGVRPDALHAHCIIAKLQLGLIVRDIQFLSACQTGLVLCPFVDDATFLLLKHCLEGNNFIRTI